MLLLCRFQQSFVLEPSKLPLDDTIFVDLLSRVVGGLFVASSRWLLVRVLSYPTTY